MPASYVTDLSEALTVGLRSSSHGTPDSQHLIECHNVMPYMDGLRPFTRLTDPFLVEFSPTTRAWPFPQFFKGTRGMYLLEDDAIYTVNDSLEVYALSVVDAYTGAAGVINPGGGMWQFVDFGPTWIFINNSNIVFRDNANFDGGISAPKVAHNVPITTAGLFRGTLFTGGFTENRLWQDDWKTIFETYRDRLPAEFANLPYTLNENFVLWSSVNSSDLAFRWLLYPDEAQTGYTASSGYSATRTNDVDRTLLMDAIEKNECGMMPMPWKGKPLAIKAIEGQQSGVVVYGSAGITALLHYSEPFSTFGIKHISDVGIKGRGSVGGNSSMHVFLDREGCLWKMGADLVPQPLGYEEYLADMGEVIITNRESWREKKFYICDETEGYTLTERGLSSQSQLISSSVIIDNVEYGTTLDVGTDEIFLVTETMINGSLETIKRVTQVNVLGTTSVALDVAVDYKYSPDEPFIRTDWTPVNERGMAAIIIAGTEYRIVVRQVPSGGGIRGLQYRWQPVDRRGKRGPDTTSNA